MQHFSRDGIDIAYVDEGEGDPMLLIHGFGSDVRVCWRLPGWIEALTHAGRRVIAFDMRGHGQSTKLYDPAHYSARLISEDAAALLEHLSVERVDVLGYSFGALIGAFLSLDYPSKVKSLVLGGLGMALNIGVGDTWEKIIRTFHGSGKKEVKDLDEKYEFSSRTRPDVQALAACMYVLRENSLDCAALNFPSSSPSSRRREGRVCWFGPRSLNFDSQI